MEIKSFNSIEAINNKFYVVKKGREVGIYATWEEAKIQTDGYPNNSHCIVEGKSHALGTLKEALELRSIIEELSDQELEVLDFCVKHYKKEDDLKFPSIF